MTGSERDRDGRFVNPSWIAAPIRSVGGSTVVKIIRGRLQERRESWPSWITDPPPDGDPQAEPNTGRISVTFIGHSSFLIRLPGLTILTDPMFSLRASPFSWAGPRRVRAPGRAMAGLPRIDLVLLSHNHYDHLDLPSLRALHRHSTPRVITPLGNSAHVRKAAAFPIEELDWWQQITLEQPIPTRITATPARHFSARSMRDARHALWSGFMLEAAGTRLYFAGDSGDGAHWQAIADRLGPPDLALLPIGAYAPRETFHAMHIDPEEAVRAHLTLGAKRSIGMHFGTFRLTDEPIDAPVRELEVAKAKHGVAADAFVTLAFGECRQFDNACGGTTSLPNS